MSRYIKLLQAIASLDKYTLKKACEAQNSIAYLRTCINDALTRIVDASTNARVEEIDREQPLGPDPGLDELPQSNLDFIIDEIPDSSALITILESIPQGGYRYLLSKDQSLIHIVLGKLHEAIDSIRCWDEYVVYADIHWDGTHYHSKLARVIRACETTHG